ncbi:MAG: electron transfer flavoprotein subunit alpha/FixB family protein, partial [Bacteroidota bacterium]
VVLGTDLNGIEKEIFPFGVDFIHIANDKKLFPFTTGPHAKLLIKLFQEQKPEIVLFGASSIGRDIAPRIASALKCGLTADCTSLVIGNHEDKKQQKVYENLLYQIRPAFGGNIIATIINPDTRPQIATVREGVMKKEIKSETYKGKVINIDLKDVFDELDFAVQIIDRHIEKQKINIKNSQIIIAGGYGVGSVENFRLLYDLADLLGGEVGASRAAVDAGYVPHERQIGQTGVTVRPKLYIACGISGAVQHRAGMDESSKIISINTDPHAPINQIADYTIIGSVDEVIPKMIKYYKTNSK